MSDEPANTAAAAAGKASDWSRRAVMVWLGAVYLAGAWGLRLLIFDFDWLLVSIQRYENLLATERYENLSATYRRYENLFAIVPKDIYANLFGYLPKWKPFGSKIDHVTQTLLWVFLLLRFAHLKTLNSTSLQVQTMNLHVEIIATYI